MLSHHFQIILLLALLGASAFFSGAETALFALSRHELFRLNRDPRPSRRLVGTLMTHPRRLLLTLMVCNVTINMFIFATSLSISQKLLGDQSPWGPVLGLVSPLAVTLFGEIFPKGTAIDLRLTLAVKAAPLIRVFQVALFPLTFVLNSTLVEPLTRLLIGGTKATEEVTLEELRALVEMSQQRHIIDADENAMLNGVIQLHELKVRDVMVPRVDVVAAEIHDPAGDLRSMMQERHLPKVPIYDDDIDHIVGLIFFRDLCLHPDQPLAQLVKPVGFVPEVISLTQLMNHFRQSGTQLAMVVDEYGGVVGLVTVEDVAEEIVGELVQAGDEDDQPAWEQLDERRYRVSGHVNIREWAEQFNIPQMMDDRVTTLAGLVMARLGRVPSVGDEVQLSNLRLRVDVLRGRRIEWITLELLPPGPTALTDLPSGGAS